MNDENDNAKEAVRLVMEGHKVIEKIQAASPEDRDPYGKQAMGIWAQAQVHAMLAVAHEVRILNLGRDQFYREVLEVLTQAKNPERSPRPGQPATATVCRVCGRPGECTTGPLNGAQWRAHLRYAKTCAPVWAETDAEKHDWAVGPITQMFGPCPEES